MNFILLGGGCFNDSLWPTQRHHRIVLDLMKQVLWHTQPKLQGRCCNSKCLGVVPLYRLVFAMYRQVFAPIGQGIHHPMEWWWWVINIPYSYWLGKWWATSKGVDTLEKFQTLTCILKGLLYRGTHHQVGGKHSQPWFLMLVCRVNRTTLCLKLQSDSGNQHT